MRSGGRERTFRRRPMLRSAASVAAALLIALASGCENMVARVDGGSETGVDNAEFGIRF